MTASTLERTAQQACPAPGCGNTLRDRTRVLCDRCWAILTPQARRQVYDAWDYLRTNPGSVPAREHLARILAGVLAVARRAGPR